MNLYFERAVLSYEVGVMKPDSAIFAAAADRAGVSAGDIFYADDLEANVVGARKSGFDAVQFTSVPALVDELWKRGLAFNY